MYAVSSDHPGYWVPSGLVHGPDDLPNLPYRSINGAILNSWREAHWANWMFEIESYDSQTREFTFGKGGFQVETDMHMCRREKRALSNPLFLFLFFFF